MNIEKLNVVVETAKSELGAGLVNFTIGDSQGNIIVSTNQTPNLPKAVAFMNSVTEGIKKSLKISGFPDLKDYYLVDVHQGIKLITSQYGDYTLGISVYSEKIKLGMLLSVVLPEVLRTFKEAVDAE